MSRVQPKKKIFFSRYCIHCKDFLGGLKIFNLLGFFDEYICVDFNRNLPDFVKVVPTIVVPGDTQLPISGDDACAWLGEKINKIQQVEQKKEEVKEQGVVGASASGVDMDGDEKDGEIKSIGLGSNNMASINDSGPMFSTEDQARFNQQHTNRKKEDFEASRALPDIPRGAPPPKGDISGIDKMPNQRDMNSMMRREMPPNGQGKQQLPGTMDGRMNGMMQQGPPLSGSQMGGNMGNLNGPLGNQPQPMGSNQQGMGSMGMPPGGNMPGMFQQNGPMPQRF